MSTATANSPTARKRVWLITGTSRGFGHALATAVLARGESLVATARRRDDAEALAENVRDGTPQLMAAELDVTDAEQTRAVMKEALERFGRVDVVVNNAGYGHFGGVEELTDEALRHQLEVNFFGTVNVTRAALPVFRRQRSGHLVQMSSLNGLEGMAGAAFYCASKFAVEGMSESLAAEVAHLGIKVTIVEPGPHRTDFASPDSAQVADPIDDYADSIGVVRNAFADLDGQQPGNPELAAEAIVAAVDSAHPPLRLPLGQTAVDSIRARLTDQLEELDRWKELSLTTDTTRDD